MRIGCQQQSGLGACAAGLPASLLQDWLLAAEDLALLPVVVLAFIAHAARLSAACLDQFRAVPLTGDQLLALLRTNRVRTGIRFWFRRSGGGT